MNLKKRIAFITLALVLFIAPVLTSATTTTAAKRATHAAPSKPARECQATCETRAEETVLNCGRNGGSESECYAAGFAAYCGCMGLMCHNPQGQCE